MGGCACIEVKNSRDVEGFQEFARRRGVFSRPFLRYIYSMVPYVITEEELQKEEAAIEQEIEDAVEYAKQAPFPANEDALINVFKEDDE